MKFILLVTGPAYGTQQSCTALSVAKSIIKKKHKLLSVFFNGDGVLNGSMLNIPSGNEINLVNEWKKIKNKYYVKLNLCISASLRRGIINKSESLNFSLPIFNLDSDFNLTSFSLMAKELIHCDKLIQF